MNLLATEVLHSLLQKQVLTSKLDYYATVNGVAVESVLIPSTDSTDEDAKAVYHLVVLHQTIALLIFAVYSAVDNFSKIETNVFAGDGSTKLFTLDKNTI